MLNLLILIITFIIFHNGGFLNNMNKSSSANAMFVYYQNYEYLSTIKLNDYTGYYGNVKLLRYSIPTDVLSAIWRLQLVATDSCLETNVYFYLEYAAYPVISPYNRTFPQYFNTGRVTKTFIKKSIGGGASNGGNRQDVYLNVSSPYAGYWFSAAFIDNNDQMVKPDLLRNNCSFYLTASINLWQINDTVVLYPNQSRFSTDHSIFKIYKYITTSNYDGPITFIINFNNSINISSTPVSQQQQQCSITALLRQSAFPDMASFKNNNDFIVCTSNGDVPQNECKLSIQYPVSNTWHFLAVTSNCNYTVRVESKTDCYLNHFSLASQPIGINIEPQQPPIAKFSQEEKQSCLKLSPPIETFRFIGPTYFSVKYYFNSNYNRSNTLLIRNERKPYFIEFLVDLANNGGTLNFHLVNNLVNDPTYNYESATTTTTSTTTTYSSSTTSSTNDPNNLEPNNLSLSLLRLLNDNNNNNNNSNTYQKRNNNNQQFKPRYKDYNVADVKTIIKVCLLYNSMSTYNKCPEGYELSTQSYVNIYTNLHMSIPYPQMGKWYLAVWKECYDSITNESVSCPIAYVPYAVIQISSDQCANDYCGDFGTCYIINSQLNLVSACKCSGGHEGYGCTDSRNAIPGSTYLASVLFLTLSNMLFFIPICLAIYRRWYIEALIYFYNMFFSTFYHACDQDFHSFCIFNYDGLQLADFISSYSSFVITILAMSKITRPWKVFSYFLGTLICLSINLYDRFSHTAFIIFLCTAICFTVLTWCRICWSKRKLYPSGRVLLTFYLPGFVLAFIGILIYSFLQTKTNYWILHSIWHMCMAVSIIFFMPKRETPIYKTAAAGDNLKDVTTTTSSLSDSSGNSNQSPQFTIMSNDTTNNNIINNDQTEIILPIQIGNNASEASTPT